MGKIEDFSEDLRDVFHYPKENENRYERATSAALDTNGNSWGCVSFEDNGNRVIALQAIDSQGECIYERTIRDRSIPSSPALFAGNDGGMSAAWIEWVEGRWSVVYAHKPCAEPEFSISTVHRSRNACLQPAMCVHDGAPLVVWSGYDETCKRFVIFSSQYENQKWDTPVARISGEGQCFRPVVCSGPKSLFIAWDEGMEGCQQIAVKEIILGDRTERNYTIRREGERLIRPALLIDGSSVCMLVCISIKDVIDSTLCISDHSTGIVFATISDGNMTVDSSLAADLNEGLLGKTVYVPYFGLRRKCSLINDPDGGIWLTWEMRFEEERDDVAADDRSKFSYEHYGYLIGKKRQKDGLWQEPAVLHQGGTCYSLSGVNADGRFGVAYLKQSNVFILPVLTLAWAGLETQAPFHADKSGYGRWDMPQPRIVKTDRYEAEADGQRLGLYWADTHIHSNLSPDAEGEPDELILYGRDIAGLDAMAMVDNDYYPHAGLMRVEWERQQALAKAFTQPGRFAVFPGYEFTYHDKNMKPNFNHRYVIYPYGGKYLARLDPKSRNLESLARELEGSKAILVAHHPSWKLDRSQVDRFVEICSSWRISMEEKDFIKDRLMEGQQFAFIGSSDTHRACPGLGGALTGIYAQELEPGQLFDAYRKRRTIVTQGLRIAIDFHVDSLFIGDSGRVGSHPCIRLNIVSPEDIEFVEIYRDNDVIKRYEHCGKTCTQKFEDDALTFGKHFYYVRVKALGDPSFNEPDSDRKEYSGPFIRQGRYPFNFARAQGPFAWSTPIWVELTGNGLNEYGEE